MGLIRLIIIVFLGWLLFRLFRHWQNRLSSKPTSSGEKIDTMVKCAQCGVHVPQKSAIESNGQFFCCEEHKENFSG
jgi:uncharacterized protein